MTYTYTVVWVREKMISGKMSGDKLEDLLNQYAQQGWRLKAITSSVSKAESVLAAWRDC